MFKKGQSGNPTGRPKGVGYTATLKRAIAEQSPAILQTVIDAALAGDMQAATFLLGRIMPTVKPVAEPVKFNLDENSLTASAESILKSIATGKLSPDVGAGILKSLADVQKVKELDEIEQRVSELERQHENH